MQSGIQRQIIQCVGDGCERVAIRIAFRQRHYIRLFCALLQRMKIFFKLLEIDLEFGLPYLPVFRCVL